MALRLNDIVNFIPRRTTATETTPVVEGKRIITRHPERADICQRREGRIENDAHKDTRWHGATIGECVDNMNADLGKVDDGAYEITE